MSTHGSPPDNEQVNWQTALSSVGSALQDKLAPVSQFLIENRATILGAYYATFPSIKDLDDTQLKGLLTFDVADLETLMKHGWYLNPNLSLVMLDLLIQAFDEDPDGASEKLAELIESELSQIQDSLANSAPDRREILRQAFYAHRTKLYNLSVPVFLAQADGMWRDRLGRHLFDRGGPAKAATEYERLTPDDMTRSILSSFSTQVPLWFSETKREADFNALNRHQVLHGETTDYGTREYSLKAISFLYFVAFLLDSGTARSSTST